MDRHTVAVLTALALALLMPAGTARAHSAERTQDLLELSLEELAQVPVATVYGASKYAQKVTQAPASISIVTAAEIRKFGYRTLADVLRSLPGVYVADDRNYAYVGVRGFLRPGDYNTRVLMLVDGHRMNDNVYDSVYVGREAMIDVDLIERVEFIRGPSSSIYGSDAFFGVINIITRRGAEFDGAEVSGEYGSNDAYEGRASYGKLLGNGVELLLSGSYYSSAGEERLYYPEFDPRISSAPGAANNGVAERADAEDAASFFGSARYREWTLSGFASSRRKEIPTASFGTVFNDARAETTDERAWLDLRYERSLRPDTQLLARAFYDRYYYYGTYPYDFAAPPGPPDIVLNKDRAFGEWLGTEWQLTRVYARHTLLLGAELRKNLTQKQVNYNDSTPRSYGIVDDRSSEILSLFVQDEYKLHDKLLLNAGLRYDHYYDGFGGTLNPRLGLIYTLSDDSTIKALYGEAFRAPNVYEQFYNSAQARHPELEPETIHTAELVFERYFRPHHRLRLSAYQYHVHDLISQAAEPSGELFFENVGRINAEGVELEWESRLDNGLRAQVSYALQRTEDTATGEELSSSPRQLAKLNLSLPPWRGQWLPSLELQYYDDFMTLSGGHSDDFLLANLTLVREELARNLDLSLGVYNLFDETYAYPGAEDHLQDTIGQDGRSVRLKLDYRF